MWRHEIYIFNISSVCAKWWKYSNDYFGVMIMSLGGIYMSDGPTYMAW